MIWLLYVIVWIVAPFVELGIIIALLVVNGKRKKQIAELDKQIKNQPEINSGQKIKVQEPKAQAAKPWLPGKKAPALAPVPASASV